MEALEHKNYLLLDKPENYDTAFIAKKIGIPMTEHYTRRTKIVLWGMFCACVSVLCRSAKGDRIVCWYDFQAIMCWWLCRLFFLRREIICINLLLKQKKTLKNQIATFLYKKALCSNNFKATVTSLDYGMWLNKKMGIDVTYTLLCDVCHDYYFAEEKGAEGYVFCGGNSERDWDLMFNVARRLPDVRFEFVMSDGVYAQYGSPVLPNVKVTPHIPFNDFMQKIYRSSMVCFPIATEAPAGLTVMISAAVNNKLIMMTDTPTTRGYINDERGVLLDNDVEKWAESILYHMQHTDVAEKKAERLKEFLITECNEEEFVRVLRELIEKQDENFTGK